MYTTLPDLKEKLHRSMTKLPSKGYPYTQKTVVFTELLKKNVAMYVHVHVAPPAATCRIVLKIQFGSAKWRYSRYRKGIDNNS